MTFSPSHHCLETVFSAILNGLGSQNSTLLGALHTPNPHPSRASELSYLPSAAGSLGSPTCINGPCRSGHGSAGAQPPCLASESTSCPGFTRCPTPALHLPSPHLSRLTLPSGVSVGESCTHGTPLKQESLLHLRSHPQFPFRHPVRRSPIRQDPGDPKPVTTLTCLLLQVPPTPLAL